MTCTTNTQPISFPNKFRVIPKLWAPFVALRQVHRAKGKTKTMKKHSNEVCCQWLLYSQPAIRLLTASPTLGDAAATVLPDDPGFFVRFSYLFHSFFFPRSTRLFSRHPVLPFQSTDNNLFFQRRRQRQRREKERRREEGNQGNGAVYSLQENRDPSRSVEPNE